MHTGQSSIEVFVCGGVHLWLTTATYVGLDALAEMGGWGVGCFEAEKAA